MFDLVFLNYFPTKIGSFCAHYKEKSLLLSIAHFSCPLWLVGTIILIFSGHLAELVQLSVSRVLILFPVCSYYGHFITSQ